MALYPVVLCGGSGTRLWPLSRADRPKFLLQLLGDGRSLLQTTLDRLAPVSDGVCVPRRRSTRLQLCAPALVTEDGGEVRACQTRDVSADGVTLEGAGALSRHQFVSVTVMLPEDGGAFCADARVADRGDDGVTSLAFLGLDRDDRRRLTGFVTEQVRKRLSIVRSLQEQEGDDWD